MPQGPQHRSGAPLTAISTLQEALAGSDVQIASQNVHWEASGAFTGEISAEMLLELGWAATIVGQSELRKYFSESDEQINQRARLLGRWLDPHPLRWRKR